MTFRPWLQISRSLGRIRRGREPVAPPKTARRYRSARYLVGTEEVVGFFLISFFFFCSWPVAFPTGFLTHPVELFIISTFPHIPILFFWDFLSEFSWVREGVILGLRSHAIVHTYFGSSL